MDIQGTDGNDTLVQTTAKDAWDNYFGKQGNDIFRLYQGTAIGGAGNDTIERIASPDWWRAVQAAYWDSPAGVVVDLAGGWAQDGWGTRDTLIGVRDVAGSWNDDRLYGDGADNTFYAGGGTTLIDGRSGADVMWLPVLRDGMTLDEFTIAASIDGTSATITWSGRPELKVTLNNVERIGVGYQVSYALTDFIRPEDMAQQALVAGDAARWNAGAALGSATEVSFGFVTGAPASGVGASGFAAFDAAQRAAVRDVLSSLERVAGLRFREVTGDAANDGAQLRFGASQQASTKGVAGLPGSASAGQVWMDTDSVVDVTPGSEGYAALLHEIGHALGLRHPRNVDASDRYSAQWRVADDVTSLSVMSQTVSGDGLFPSAWGALDITALRYLYGAAPANAGDTVYLLGTRQFQSQTSITDDGGIDLIDAAAAASGVAIDLAPGHLSSVGVTAAGLAAIDNLAITPGSMIENASGSEFDDVIVGNALGNRLTGGKGNDWIDGGAGSDSAVFGGVRADYLVSTGFGKVFVTARDGVSGFDTLLGIETLVFGDSTLRLAGAARGADISIDVDQNSSVRTSLPASSDSGTVAYAITQGPAHGTLTLSGAGVIEYTPRVGFSSEDRFTYTLRDANGASNEYVGFITVRAISATATGTDGADALAGTGGNDIVDAGAGNDVLAGSGGSDALNGGAGLDTVRYALTRAAATISVDAQGAVTLGKGGATIDTLLGVERVEFSNGAVAFDLEGSAGQAYRLYQAAFDRKPDAGGLGFWIYHMDRGLTPDSAAGGFMGSPEFVAMYGATPTAEQFVTRLYNNVLHRAPEQDGFNFWIKALDGGYTRAQVLQFFADSPENHAQVIGSISGGIDYLPHIA